MNPHTIEQTSRNVLTVRFKKVSKGWEQWVLLRSDAHHDNIHCNRDLETAHLKKAKERGALIIDAGDLFCAMQGKYDPRSSMDDLRPEDKGEDYLDRIVRHAAEDYGPFAKNFLVIGKGNHETNIRKRHGTDLTSNLVHRLNSDYSGACHVGYYGGWVRFKFQIHKTKSTSKTLKYFHGKSTSAPVTKGVIQTARQAAYLEGANVVLNGHNHEAYVVPRRREFLSDQGKVAFDITWFVRTPGYKDGYGDGAEGFEVEKLEPKPMGCVWLRLAFENTNGSEIVTECIQDLV